MSQTLDHQTGQHTPADRPPNKHTVEDFWVCVHSEMMHLTLKRLEALGSLEVKWVEGWRYPLRDGVGWGGEDEWYVEQLDGG